MALLASVIQDGLLMGLQLILMHPHYDTSKQFSLIHNGIIENYIPLKKFLEQKGVEFYTQTDTEVLIQFISYMHDKEKTHFSESVRLALKEVVGAYGIVVMNKQVPRYVSSGKKW